MNLVKASSITDLWGEVNNEILWASSPQLAYVSSLDTMMTDCVAEAKTCEYDLNIGRDLWLTPVRWTTLIRQYIDPQRLAVWLDGCEVAAKKKRGINGMDFKEVGSTTVSSNVRASRRKWGGCLRMVVFRPFPQPTISLYSRTSYLGYIGGLDLMVGHKLAQQVGQRLGIGVEDIAFRWHCDVWQFHGFKSMAYIIASGQEKYLTGKRPQLEEDYPTWKLVRYWWKRLLKHDKEGKTYDDMKYGAEIRIRRRYHGSIGETRFGGTKNKASQPLSTPIKELTLDKVLL